MRRAFYLFSIFFVVSIPAFSKISVSDAMPVFSAAQKACQQAGDTHWGIEFCGHTLFIDPADRSLIGFDLSTKKMVRAHDLFQGAWPENEPISNTTRYWRGKQWAVITWPLKGNSEDQTSLILHENFHRIQGILHFSAGRAVNAFHLDDYSGRLSLRLEARALKRALLETSGPARLVHLATALKFRSDRMEGNDRAVRSERYFNLFEGLAEYTGHKAGRADMTAFLVDHLTELEHREDLDRSFPYFLGPAWGAMLDQDVPDWRLRLDGRQDLADIYSQNVALPPVSKIASDLYGEQEFKAAESLRQKALDEKRSILKTRFVTGKVLVLPAESFAIDPRLATSVGEHGRVFPWMEASGRWGELSAESGAMMGPRPPWVYVEVVEDENGLNLKNDSWSLTLNEGWHISDHPRGYTVSED